MIVAAQNALKSHCPVPEIPGNVVTVILNKSQALSKLLGGFGPRTAVNQENLGQES